MSDDRNDHPQDKAATKAPRRRRLYAADTAAMAAETEVTPPTATAKGAAVEATQVATQVATPITTPVAATKSAALPATRPAVTAPRRSTRSPLLRDIRSRQTIRDHALLAAGAMVIPVPLVDMAAEAAIQVRMIKRLAEIYSVDFTEERAKTLVAAAIGGFSAGWAAATLLRYASFTSYFINFWPSAALSSAITYGIGHLFAQHFSKGGHLDDLAPEVAADTLRAKAHSLRTRLRGKTTAKPASPVTKNP